MGRDQAKAELVEMLDRRSPSYAKLDANEKWIVEIILTNQRNGEPSNMGTPVLIRQHNNREAGHSMDDYVHLDILCSIIRKLAL